MAPTRMLHAPSHFRSTPTIPTPPRKASSARSSFAAATEPIAPAMCWSPIPAASVRRASQGVATPGSILCSVPQLVTVRGNECTVIATGTDDVQLAIDPKTGQVIPTSGKVCGTYAVVVQLDNPTDSPELPVQTGTFSGVINFQPPSPLGLVSEGIFTIDALHSPLLRRS